MRRHRAHYDVIVMLRDGKPPVRMIHWSPADFPHKGPVMWSFGVFFGCEPEQADFRRHRAHYDVAVLFYGHVN